MHILGGVVHVCWRPIIRPICPAKYGAGAGELGGAVINAEVSHSLHFSPESIRLQPGSCFCDAIILPSPRQNHTL